MQDLGFDGTIILKLILNKWDGRVCPGYKNSGYGQLAGLT